MTHSVFHEAEVVADLTAGPDGPAITYRLEWLKSPTAFPISLFMALTEGAWPSRFVSTWLAEPAAKGGSTPGDGAALAGRSGGHYAFRKPPLSRVASFALGTTRICWH